MKRFALTGAAGYIAPRHMKAIKDTGNVLVAALDPFESVGIIDSYFPEAEFFTEPEAFEAFLEEARAAKGLDYVSIATPNYLHYPQIRMSLRLGADALCEKPLVLGEGELDRLVALEAETGRRVWTVLQLRVHPALVALREKLAAEGGRKKVVLTYVTGRGKWYLKSWKGDVKKSGGLATNIGVHFFDMLAWLFGDVRQLEVHAREEQVVAGYMELERAEVSWFLAIDDRYVPADLRTQGQRTYRSITVDGEEIEFSGGFTDLHTEVYRRTLAGQGFSLEDTRTAIRTTERIRTLEPGGRAPRHPFLEQS